MDKNSSETRNGFYTVDAVSLHQSSKKPHHLEKRFKRDLNISNAPNCSNHKKNQVEIKREAILEERRNRLNQNFLKVKRIAKEAKDRQQDKINVLSRSMQVAETNRNLYIEQRRANSKKTVERAKCIVLQNQLRSEQEQERRRAELESRLQKTEARRLAHLSRYKAQENTKKVDHSSSLPATKTVVMPSTSAVAKNSSLSPALQLPKKKPSSWSIILRAFRDLGLPLPSQPNTWLEFNSLGQLLHQAKVIVVTTKVLNTALKLTDEDSRHRARVLLTSYMTLMCPKEVLQDVNGAEEKRLHAASKNMLQLFETWLRAHGRPGATTARLAFVDAWNDYNLLFETWKSRDCDQLVRNMISYYVELSTLRQTVIAQQNGDESVGEQLKQQLQQVKTKLEKIGGSDALEILQRALEASASSTSTGRRKQQQKNTPRSPEMDGEYETQRNATNNSANPKQLAQLLNSYTPSSGLKNEQLAHELIMDPEFKLQRYEPSNELEKRVRMMAEKAFFDKIAQDIEQGTAQLSLPALIKDVKNRLLSLVRPGTSMHNSINDAIDLTIIEQQLQLNSFNIQSMIHYVLDTMASMCAPVRDEEIQKVRASSESMTEQIKQVIEILENMSLDLSNFRLRSLRPHLMSMAVEYERDKFASMLNDGTIQLVRTKTWLSQSTDRLCQVAAQRNPEGIQPQKNNKPSHDAIFEDAFVSLLCQPQPIDRIEQVPETLALDAKRMADFQNEVQATTMVAALIMLARNFGSASPQTLSDLAVKLFTILEDGSTTIDNLVSEIELSVNVKPERREMVKTMVDKTVSHNDTVYTLLSRRVALVIKSTVHNNAFVTDAVLSSNGLEHVRSHLQSISLKIQRLAHHHRKVYASWYDEIITEALNESIIVTPTVSKEIQ
ncbi:T-complex protein 11-domain-containing protein [Parasitella parasitica]|nr:T-complex protein 11-domain-containing protein [Parasitella parasitica]